MKKIIFLVFILFQTLIYAQFRKQITYGFYAGANYSQMSNLKNVFIPQNFYQGFNTNEEGKIGAVAGFFLNWKYEEQRVSIQPEIFYSRQTTDFNYNDIKGLNYTVNFSYDYLNAGFLIKYYPTEQFYIGAGPNLALNISSDNIKYTSNSKELSASTVVYFEPDIVVQKYLKESIEGKNYFQTIFGLGYEFNNGLIIGARYHLGISDALETKENGFRFIENKNKTTAYSIHIGYRFDFDALNNF